MAPEQVTAPDNIDHRVDIYALGVLLYEMVCGRPPYDSDTVHDLMRLHLEGRPERLPGIPDVLWEIISGCLEQKPRLRPTAGRSSARPGRRGSSRARRHRRRRPRRSAPG
jgi:serine/threonine-protein kinase